MLTPGSGGKYVSFSVSGQVDLGCDANCDSGCKGWKYALDGKTATLQFKVTSKPPIPPGGIKLVDGSSPTSTTSVLKGHMKRVKSVHKACFPDN